MDKINKLFLDPSTERMWPTPEVNQAFADLKVRITDERVARLLLLLYELDESMAGLEELSKTQLSELISFPILACGVFVPLAGRYGLSPLFCAIQINNS